MSIQAKVNRSFYLTPLQDDFVQAQAQVGKTSTAEVVSLALDRLIAEKAK
jgi:hypothetical protein